MLQSLVKTVRSTVENSVSDTTRATWSMRAFGLTKVPLLLYCAPSVHTLNDKTCIIKIPLNWRTRNHYRSMYFGALAVGADCAAGFMAMHHMDQSGHKVQLLFKDFHADFLRRPEGDVHFVCDEGLALKKLVAQAIQTGERVNHKVSVAAIVPSQSDEPAATFTLTVSLKKARG
jgi:hypothetical protein